MDQTVANDVSLIEPARLGDREAFARLVERHYDFIYRVAFRWCGHKADAEDIAQEVCARLGKAIRSYAGAGALTTWLYTLTLNAARDYRRKSLREDVKQQAFFVHAQSLGAAAVEPETGEADPAHELWAAVRELSTKQREAVLLVYGEELSHAGAADVMGVSEATVSWHVHEAKKRLRVIMRGEV